MTARRPFFALSPRADLPTLPPEVIELIIDLGAASLPVQRMWISPQLELSTAPNGSILKELDRNKSIVTRYAFLLSVMRVCRIWKDLAGPKLWDNVTLRHPASLAHFLALQKTSEMLARVCRFELDAQADLQQQARISELIAQMGRLKELKLERYPGHLWSLPLSLLFRLTCESSFRLRGDATAHASVATAMSVLDLGEADIYNDLLDTPGPHAIHLRRLWVSNSPPNPPNTILVLDPLILDAVLGPSLVELGLVDHGLPGPQWLKYNILQRICRIGMGLRSLQFTWTAQRLDDFTTIVDTCASLQNLTVFASLLAQPIRLPPTLSKLRIYCLAFNAAEEMRVALDANLEGFAMTNLGALTIASRRKSIFGFKEYEKRLRDMGISVRYEERQSMWSDWME